MCYNCIDRHVLNPELADEKALIYISNMTNSKIIYTYRELQKEVRKFAYVL